MKQLVSLTKRQESLFRLIQDGEKTTNQRLLEALRVDFAKISRVTLIRDLNVLLRMKCVKRIGQGRGVRYEPKIPPFIKNIDPQEYFQHETDMRKIQKIRIDFTKKKSWFQVFSEIEFQHLLELTQTFQNHMRFYSPKQIQKEFERITIEFSWKSSRIEGNTYSLLDTEYLIKNQHESPHHSHEEAVMILNHKAALEYAWSHPKYFKKLTLKKIEELHSLIVKNLHIAAGIRKRPVGIVGTKYKPYDNYYQVREELEELCNLINKLSNPFLKALAGIAGLSYIQAFEDGNKRTSRILGNAILLAHNACPLSYRSINEVDYKKAVILFYEQHSLSFFKKLFMEQYEFAIKNYFL
ncbi:Fic family protein [Candidatus Peregrinibacteria bacterium]|nr:Fic family protein [Candidatus Peregrinibacteria bacterium]